MPLQRLRRRWLPTRLLPPPTLIFVDHGFPEETYSWSYPAPGDPKLADQICGLLVAAGHPAELDPDRGFDHGVFIPLMLAYVLVRHTESPLYTPPPRWLKFNGGKELS